MPAGSGVTTENAKKAAKLLRSERRAEPRVDKTVGLSGTEMVKAACKRRFETSGPADPARRESALASYIASSLAFRAASTLDGYGSACERWEKFCAGQDIPAWPVDSWCLQEFITNEILRLKATNRTASPLTAMKKALCLSAFFAGEPKPYADPIVQVAFETGCKMLGFKNESKDPLNADFVLKVFKEHGGPEASLQSVLHILQLALSYEGVMRWDDLKTIHLGDILKFDEVWRIFLNRTKTDGLAEGQWSAIIPSTDPWSACVLLDRYACMLASAWEHALSEQEKALYAPWCDKNGALLFSKIPVAATCVQTKSGHSFIAAGYIPSPGAEPSPAWGMAPPCAKRAYNALLKRIKSWAEEQGRDPKDFGTHSGRRSLPTAALSSDLPESAPKMSGRWRSDKGYASYQDSEVVLRKHVAGLRALHLAINPSLLPIPLSPMSRDALDMMWGDDFMFAAQDDMVSLCGEA